MTRPPARPERSLGFWVFFGACAVVGLAFWAAIIVVVLHFAAKAW